MNKVIHPLKPIIDKDSKVLILGSFPSVISRQQVCYYANPNNRFWKVMSIIFNETIDDKEAFCHKHHIALWDVIKSCTINNSDDNSIANVQVNDLEKLVNNTDIKMIVTTGKKASTLLLENFDLNISYYDLPSTSSANAKMHLEELVSKYQIIKEATNE